MIIKISLIVHVTTRKPVLLVALWAKPQRFFFFWGGGGGGGGGGRNQEQLSSLVGSLLASCISDS